MRRYKRKTPGDVVANLDRCFCLELHMSQDELQDEEFMACVLFDLTNLPVDRALVKIQAERARRIIKINKDKSYFTLIEFENY